MAEPLYEGLSLCGMKWMPPQIQETARAISQKHDLSDILASLLAARGFTHENCMAFLKPTLRESLPDPLTLPDMDKAVLYVAQSLEKCQPIAIFGDYDADGITSSALLANYLDALGVTPSIHLPDRMEEGYGLSLPALESLHEKGHRLLITVDCGSADEAIINKMSQRGMQIVILDHHPTSQPPKAAAAFVNPNGSKKGGAACPSLSYLAATGVVFLFLVALNRHLREKGFFHEERQEPNLMDFMDMVALGTVCDVAPLVGANRVFVVRGLEVLRQGGNPGLAAILKIANAQSRLDADIFGFVLGPRINAAGRIGRPDAALRLLTCSGEEESLFCAKELDTLNRQRRVLEDAMTAEACARIEAQIEKRNRMPSFLLTSSEDWHVGIIGIVAARLRDRFQRPAAVVAFNEEGIGTGSARSFAGVPLGTLMGEALKEGIIQKGGGHDAAAGFTVKKSALKDLETFLEERSAPSGEANLLPIDAVIRLQGATQDFCREIDKAAPFGKGNPKPRFVLPNLRLAWANQSASGGHLRCRFEDDCGASLSAVAFRQAESPLGKGILGREGEMFHIAGTVRISWGGKVELLLEDALSTRAAKTPLAIKAA